MAQIFIYTFITIAIVVVSFLFIIGMSNKLLLCAKIYTFIFEIDDWKLYKKIKKQGIQHYLNVYHLKQFTKKWEELKKEYSIINDDFSNIDKITSHIIMMKFEELSEDYHYKEYHNVTENIKSNDVVLVGELFGDKLTIQIGYDSTFRRALYNQPMVRDILRGHDDYVFKLLLKLPQQVISF